MDKYKFLRTGFKSENGGTKWKMGQWHKFDGELELCEAGFHCSKRIYQAFNYVQGEILAQVEVRGKSIKGDDKEVWSEMRVIKAWKWQKKDSVALSIFAAELCIKNYEKEYPNDTRPRDAIEAAKRWLEKPTKANQQKADAAWSAAWSARSAARSAAESAAESAAWSAAWSARSAAWSARSAAWSARSAAWSAESAAWSAARSVLISKISKWMDNHLKEMEEIK